MNIFKILIRKLKSLYNFLKGNRMPELKYFKKKLPKSNKPNKKKILIATSAGGLKSQVVFESLLALTLEYKGCDVEILLCDKVLPICIMNTFDNTNERKIINGKNLSCNQCFDETYNLLKKSNLKVKKFSDHLDHLDHNEFKFLKKYNFKKLSIEKIKKFKINEINIGEHAYSGALRFYAKTILDDEKLGKNILLKYLDSAIITMNISQNLFKNNKYSKLVMNHGIYVPQGVIIDVAKKFKIKTSTWCPGYKKNSFCLVNDDTYHRSLIYENNKNWENINFTKRIEKK